MVYLSGKREGDLQNQRNLKKGVCRGGTVLNCLSSTEVDFGHGGQKIGGGGCQMGH